MLSRVGVYALSAVRTGSCRADEECNPTGFSGAPKSPVLCTCLMGKRRNKGTGASFCVVGKNGASEVCSDDICGLNVASRCYMYRGFYLLCSLGKKGVKER